MQKACKSKADLSYQRQNKIGENQAYYCMGRMCAVKPEISAFELNNCRYQTKSCGLLVYCVTVKFVHIWVYPKDILNNFKESRTQGTV